MEELLSDARYYHKHEVHAGGDCNMVAYFLLQAAREEGLKPRVKLCFLTDGRFVTPHTYLTVNGKVFDPTAHRQAYEKSNAIIDDKVVYKVKSAAKKVIFKNLHPEFIAALSPADIAMYSDNNPEAHWEARMRLTITEFTKRAGDRGLTLSEYLQTINIDEAVA